jgi:hypothetical protein
MLDMLLSIRDEQGVRAVRKNDMSFDDMPPHPPLLPQEAERYAAGALALSRAAATRLATSWGLAYGEDVRQRPDVHAPSPGRPSHIPVHVQSGVRVAGLRQCLPASSQRDLVFRQAPPGSGEARIRSVFLRDDADAQEALPIHPVRRSSVPLPPACGETHWPRIVESNRDTAETARQAGVLTDCIELPGLDHFDSRLDMTRADNRSGRRVTGPMAH